MTETVVARRLMRDGFRRLLPSATVRELLCVLAGVDEESDMLAVVVVDENERYRGLFTSRSLVRSLMLTTTGAPEWNRTPSDQELLGLVAQFADRPVLDLVGAEVPSVAPDERLWSLIDRACAADLEYLPVVEDGRLLGVVPVTEIFSAAAKLALTPEHEGIRKDEERAATTPRRR